MLVAPWVLLRLLSILSMTQGLRWWQKLLPWVLVSTTLCFGIKMWEGIRYIVELISPRGTPHLLAAGTYLSPHRGHAFYSRALLWIIDALLCPIGVISRYHDALMRLAVCAKCRAFAFPLWTTQGHSSSTHHPYTQHPHIIHTSSTHGHTQGTQAQVTPSAPIYAPQEHTQYTLYYLLGPFLHVLSKNLCASSLVFMRAPRLSVNYFHFYSKKACM